MMVATINVVAFVKATDVASAAAAAVAAACNCSNCGQGGVVEAAVAAPV